MKKIVIYIIISICFAGITFESRADEQTSKIVTITGVAKQPLSLTMGDLTRFQSATIQLNEVTRDGTYQGVFSYEGVSLRDILELALVGKEDGAPFFKPVDLAVVVKNREGRRVTLAWGEICYRDYADVIVAFRATPVMPLRSPNPDVYDMVMKPLARGIGLPKLVIADDLYTDRCLEDITAVQVIDLHPPVEGKKGDPLVTDSVAVTGQVDKPFTVTKLEDFPRVAVSASLVGTGRGWHGLQHCEGVSVTSLLDKAGLKDNLNTVLICSGPDGYRSLLSYGELYLSSYGKRIIVADRLNGKPIDGPGMFRLVVPEDLWGDRWNKALKTIEVMTIAHDPKVYVISVGCGESRLITLDAIAAMAKADVFVCSPDLHKRYAHYIGDRPVLFDPVKALRKVFHDQNPDLSPMENKKRLKELRDREVAKIVNALGEGKNVGFLDFGDPGIFGTWRFIGDYVNESQIEIVPGISAFNASNSMIGKDITCQGTIVITAPEGLESNEALVKAVAAEGDTLVIFMGLKKIDRVDSVLKNYYDPAVPVTIVYNAGYEVTGRLVKTTVKDLRQTVLNNGEEWLGVIYVGPCMTHVGPAAR